MNSITNHASRKRRILVLGSRGMLGHMLVRVLSPYHSVFGTTSGSYDRHSLLARLLDRDHWLDSVDVRQWDTINRVLKNTQPEVVINCVGVIKQKLESSNAIDAIFVNSLVPHQLARSCDENGVNLIHLSTDCVFEGTPGLKKVSDIPNATDLYGTTKRLGEIGYGNSLTLRTGFVGRQLSGSEGLFEWVRSQRGKTIRGFKHAIYSGLTTRALSDVIRQVIENFPNLSGLYQVASAPISKFDLICRLNELLSLNVTVVPDTEFVCDRSLDGSHFTQSTNIRIPTWDEMLVEFAGDQRFYALHKEQVNR